MHRISAPYCGSLVRIASSSVRWAARRRFHSSLKIATTVELRWTTVFTMRHRSHHSRQSFWTRRPEAEQLFTRIRICPFSPLTILQRSRMNVTSGFTLRSVLIQWTDSILLTTPITVISTQNNHLFLIFEFVIFFLFFSILTVNLDFADTHRPAMLRKQRKWLIR